MPTRFATFLMLAGVVAAPAAAEDSPRTEKAPPGGDYRKVSELVKLPDFLPGVGTLYVQPKTLPAGPFLAYDRDNRLVSTIYMVPVKDLTSRKAFPDLAVGAARVDHVDLQYNAGHPGVEEPHYHVVLWHVGRDVQATLK